MKSHVRTGRIGEDHFSGISSGSVHEMLRMGPVTF